MIYHFDGKWTEEEMKTKLLELSNKLGKFPTFGELKEMKLSGLANKISDTGGIYVWAKKLGIETTHYTLWDDDRITSELKSVIDELGKFPSCSELKARGLNALMCQITRKRGGLNEWAKRMGCSRSTDSDSDLGWTGEKHVKTILEKRGHKVDRCGIKAPWDLIVDQVLRVDVKTSRKACYRGNAGSWFYRIGKELPADVAILYQIDTRDCYIIPWMELPAGNITISQNGKYTPFKNRFDILSENITHLKNAVSVWPTF